MGPLTFDQPAKVVTTSVPLPVAQQASEVQLGFIGSPATVLTLTPTVSATPDYTAGDAMGGTQTLTGAARVSGGTVILESLTVYDKDNQKKAITILFFDSSPSAATTTDNGAFVFSTAISKLVGKVNIAAADYETVDSIGIACLKAIGLEMLCSGSANLYAVAIAGEAINLATTTALTFKYGFLQG